MEDLKEIKDISGEEEKKIVLSPSNNFKEKVEKLEREIVRLRSSCEVQEKMNKTFFDLLANDLKNMIKTLFDLQEGLEKKIDHLSGKVDLLEGKFDHLSGKVDLLEGKIDKGLGNIIDKLDKLNINYQA